jgi:mRNA interferase MazF
MPDKRRPVLVLTRDSAIPVLRTIIVAPLTTRVRGVPTEIPLDVSDGLPTSCVASLDNLTVADRALLVERQATLSPVRMAEVCRALRLAVDC